MNTASSLYRELTAEELQSVVQKHFAPRGIASSKLLSGGLFNTTYFVELTDGLKMVLRLGPVNRHLLMLFEENMMAAEAHVYDLCRAEGIPVSEVLVVDTDRDAVDRDFMCVRYIPSTPLSALEPSEEIKAKLYRETGALTRRMHAITGPRFGRVSQILSGGGYDTWREAILGEIENWKVRAVPVGLYSEAELAEIDAVFARHAHLLNEIKTPHLVHADLWSGNVLISGENDDLSVAAIIDADRALFGDADFAFASAWMINDAFVEGYGSAPSADDASVTRRMLYALIYALLDGYVWLHQYNNQENSDGCHTHALELIEQLKKR